MAVRYILVSKLSLYQIIYDKREAIVWGYRAIENNTNPDPSATTYGLSDNMGISHELVSTDRKKKLT